MLSHFFASAPRIRTLSQHGIPPVN